VDRVPVRAIVLRSTAKGAVTLTGQVRPQCKRTCRFALAGRLIERAVTSETRFVEDRSSRGLDPQNQKNALVSRQAALDAGK